MIIQFFPRRFIIAVRYRVRPKCVLLWSISFTDEGIAISDIFPHFNFTYKRFFTEKLLFLEQENQNRGEKLFKELNNSFLSVMEIYGIISAISYLMSCIL